MIDILSIALNSGLFAALFCFLFIFQLRDSKEREKKLVSAIDALLEGLKGISAVDEKCESIVQEVKIIREYCKDNKALSGEARKSMSIKKVRERKV